MSPELSVLIPVFNGLRTLPATLAAWLDQQCDRSWELLLVDNGSSDGSIQWLKRNTPRLAEEWRIPIRCMQEARPGQSAASNRAAQEAKGKLLVFSAQDMLPGPGFLDGHLQAHARSRSAGRCILGHIAYPSELLQDPFLRCLVEETVYQFGFGAIGDPEDANPRCLYAPNFSLPKSCFLETGGFDERFPYGWQDTDLGLRLSERGVPLVYRKELTALHDHPLEWRGFCGRMHAIGRDFPLFLRKHPDFENQIEVDRHLQMHFHDARRLVSSAQKLVRLWELAPEDPFPELVLQESGSKHDTLSAAFVLLLKYHFYKGVYDGRRKLAGNPWVGGPVADAWTGNVGRTV